MNARRLRFVFASGLVGAALVAMACGDILESPDADPQVDGGAADDATADTSDDGNVGPDGSCTNETPVFDDTFPIDSISKWTTRTNGCTKESLSFVDRATGDRAVSLNCLSADAGAYKVLETSEKFPVKAQTFITFSFLAQSFDANPAAEHVFGQLLDILGLDTNVALRVRSDATLDVTHGSTAAVLTNWGTVDYAKWHTLSLAVVPKDPSATVLSVRANLDGVPRAFDVMREPDAGASDELALQLGPYTPSLPAGDYTVVYDDVRVWSCP